MSPCEDARSRVGTPSAQRVLDAVYGVASGVGGKGTARCARYDGTVFERQA